MATISEQGTGLSAAGAPGQPAPNEELATARRTAMWIGAGALVLAALTTWALAATVRADRQPASPSVQDPDDPSHAPSHRSPVRKSGRAPGPRRGAAAAGPARRRGRPPRGRHARSRASVA